MTPALDAIGRLGEAKSLLAAAARAGVAGLDDSALVLAASTAEELGRLVDALRVQLAEQWVVNPGRGQNQPASSCCSRSCSTW